MMAKKVFAEKFLRRRYNNSQPNKRPLNPPNSKMMDEKLMVGSGIIQNSQIRIG